MTKQESFKRRIRTRMATTGERYAAARKALIDKAPPERTRVWVSEPEMSNDAILAKTGRGWEEWCAIIERWPNHPDGHTAIATYLHAEQDVDAWWAQTITVGYERITGLRLPYQRPDGTFTAGTSKTLTADHDMLRSLLLDDQQRADLFPGIDTELRSKPTTKAIRLAVGPGVARIGLTPAGNGRLKVTVSHEKLPTFGDVAEWKFYWHDWLQALDEKG